MSTDDGGVVIDSIELDGRDDRGLKDFAPRQEPGG
jgi:hypothetical protein